MLFHSTGTRAQTRGLLCKPAALCLALAACVTVVQAQAQAQASHHSPHTPVANPSSWTDANDNVGQFPQGHIDLLRWEKKNHPALPVANPKEALAGEPLSLDQALRQALQSQPRWLVRAGMSATDKAQLNTSRQAQVLQVKRAWTEAVAAHQSIQFDRQILEAAEAGTELAERMARTGNWSRARQMQEELLLWDARTQVQSAELKALQTQLTLWQRVGGQSHLAKLPELPDLPALDLQPLATLEAQALAAHWEWPVAQADARRQLQGQTASSLALVRQALAQHTSTGLAAATLPANLPWNHAAENALQTQADADAMQRQIRADVRIAHAVYLSARAQAEQSQNEVQRLHTALQQESLLRYNGMLQSTWDLLASARQRILSEDAAHQAKRQAWLAWHDLQAVLSGLPYSGGMNTASGTSATTAPAQGH